MNKYFHLAAYLTSLSSLGSLTLAIANERVSFAHENVAVNNFQAIDRSLTSPKTKVIIPNPELSQITQNKAHQKLNEIAHGSLITAILEGKLKENKVKTVKAKPVAISQTTITLVKEAEGFRASAYLDTDGTPVIGYGQSRIQGRKVRLGDRISYQAADLALRAELNVIQQEILSTVKVELNSNQLGALTSLAFNTGIYRVKKSTLVRKLNQQDYLGAANEFLRWDKANIRGTLVRMNGLSKRRSRERQLFLTPVNL